MIDSQNAISYLNLGCGQHYHPLWTNVDFTSTGEGVIAYNLRQGIPFLDASFDAVYHSHLLEHLPQTEATFFLQQCFRVLRPRGILRVVVPDLEQIVRLYLTALENIHQGSQEWNNHYRWILLEMYDQAVRESSGGQMLTYLAQDPIPNEDFVIQRIGKEAENLIVLLRQLRSQPQPTPLHPSERELLLKELLGEEDYQSLEIGRFRRSGEVHHWMYDRYSLQVLLESVGFEQVRVCQANESLIPNFTEYGLDVETDGRVRKPDSLFMEAIKPHISEVIAANEMMIERKVIESTTPKDFQDLPQVQALQQTIQQLQTELAKKNSRLKKIRKKLQLSQSERQSIESELEQSCSIIKSMENSKFWKLRSLLVSLKQSFSTLINNFNENNTH